MRQGEIVEAAEIMGHRYVALILRRVSGDFCRILASGGCARRFTDSGQSYLKKPLHLKG